MLNYLIGAVIAGSPLVIGELVHRFVGLGSEISRKIIHVLAGIITSCLVLFLTLHQIASIATIFFIVLIIVRQHKIVTALYSVERQTYGEIFYPLGVLIAALLTKDSMMFVAIMLIVGFADTAACLVGQYYKNKILIFGQKTLAGSTAFFIVTLLILGVLSSFSLTEVFFISLTLTLTEVISDYGLDNLSVPIVFGILYSILI